MDLIGGYAQMGMEKDLRPYKLLAGRPNLVCDWRWIQPRMSVGWIPTASLYNATSPHADAKGHWNPGFYHELAIKNWNR